MNVALNRTFVTGLPVAHPSYKMGPVFRSGTNRTLARLLCVLVRKTEKKPSSHYIQIYPANVLLCYVKSIPLSQLRLSNFELLQWKRRKTIRSGGGIQHFQVDFKFWHYTTSKFDL